MAKSKKNKGINKDIDKTKKTKEQLEQEFVTGLISKELDVIIALELHTIKKPDKVDINAFGKEILDIVKGAKTRDDLSYRFFNLFDLMH